MQGASVDEAIASTIQKPAAATRQSAPPAPEGFRTLTENSAHILFPADNEVFYNNAQIFNRDLSVLVARLLLGQKREEAEAKLAKRVQRWEAARDAGKPMTSKHPAEGACTGARILDALSASGLRAIRYAKELEHLSLVLANDIEAPAVESIRRNVAFNGLDPSLVQVRHADAALTMMMHREPASQFDLVDLDPFGSPAQFLDSAVQAVSEGGMLAVTCTDMAVLCGNHSEACFGKYGAMPLRGKHCHEFALRLVLGCLQTHASRYKRYIVPLLSCSIDFYIRIFVRVYTSPQEVKRAASKLSHVYQCVGCGSYALQPIGKIIQRSQTSVKFVPSSFEVPFGRGGVGVGAEMVGGSVAALQEALSSSSSSSAASSAASPAASPASSASCPGCCPHCGSRMRVGGPVSTHARIYAVPLLPHWRCWQVWNRPIHDSAFQKRILQHLRQEGESRCVTDYSSHTYILHKMLAWPSARPRA
jgi:tRNA(guanine-26,N2-N2) methyltransferase